MNTKYSKYLLSLFASFLVMGNFAYAQEPEEEILIEADPDFSQITNKTELYSNNYRSMTYRFSNFASDGSITLDDGSQWTVNTEDLYKTNYWSPGDKVVIGTDMGYKAAVAAGRTFLYGMINPRTGSMVRVNNFKSALRRADNAKFLYVMSKNPDTLVVTLNDGTSWKIAKEDKDLFAEWVADINMTVGDPVIRGKYDVWFSSWDILINVISNHYVRAKQI